jgi:hydrogenase nickel incorporation protein HypA/HybF
LHELGIAIEIVKTVESFARQNGVTRIETLVLQIGELSSVIPKYIEECYPAAVDGTLLEETKLQIEILPGNAICKKCSKVFNLVAHKKICPGCKNGTWEILSGKEFMIKEIIAH